jgi:dipeptidyl aminopeptidase/acylaminoacyl peptidase
VAQVNFHGSTSFGQDFAKSILGSHGDKPYDDIMAATDHLLATLPIDPARMAAIGGSYGGYLVTWIAGHTDRFACVVNHAGVYDLLSQYASDVSQGRHVAYGGEPWSGIENVDRWSPNRFAAGFKSPMLVLHGDNDYRVPYTQGLEVYGVYKARGLEARLVSYPDENHWILQARNSRHWYGEVMGWLDRFLNRKN